MKPEIETDREERIRCKPWLCRVFGHKPNGQITGFRNQDAAAISRCARCNMPIVCSGWRASRYVMEDLCGERHNVKLTD